MPPKVIGPYRVLETIGSGGAGTVYRASDRRTGDTVALKLLATGPALDPRAARRLAREFETLAHLSHPNVVKVFDTGVFQGYPYLAMELVEGLTLRHYLALKEDDLSPQRTDAFVAGGNNGVEAAELWSNPGASEEGSSSGSYSRPFNLSQFSEEAPTDERYSSGPASVRALADAADEPDTDASLDLDLPYPMPPVEQHAMERPPPVNLEEMNHPQRIVRLRDSMLQLCEALAYIHSQGLVHRDLKPSNVMVDQERRVRLMDFGLAKFLAEDGTVTAGGRLVGTFRYMAPEQILGERVDSRSDLYSLGVILYELLAGRAPFDAPTPYELWQKALESDPLPISVLNPQTDAQLARIAMRLMQKEPDQRFQTAEETIEALLE
jgi:serine/threonine protein kinase